MTVLTVSEAQRRLPELLEAARRGQAVEIVEQDQRFRLLVLPTRPRPPVTGIPKAGRYAGRLLVPDDFDEPLDELRENME
jgi:antitoxin (DNA-binding transcriptional repressor) of toxin-antitoxin stability system